MKEHFSKYSLRNKLLIAFVSVSAAPILFIGVMLFTWMQKDTARTIRKNLQAGLDQTCAAMEQMLEDVASRPPEYGDIWDNIAALHFVQRVEKESPQRGAFTILYQAGEEARYLVLNEAYLEHFFAMGLDGDGHAVLYRDGNADLIRQAAENAGENEFITVTASLFGSDVYVAQFLDWDSQLEMIKDWMDLCIRACLIIIIISICTACGMSYGFSYRVDRLLKEMNSMKKDGSEGIRARPGEDEIALIAHTFHKLMEDLETMTSRNLKLKISERDARIKALQSQISPHFLYNALDSINWNLIEHGDWETSKILVALSSMLRYSIEDSDDMVKAEEELEQVENYLIVQKSRFSDRFDYSIHIDDRVRSVLVPKMILQPIVENAICHGLESAKNGQLTIQVLARDFGMEIIVEDDGVGIPPDKLEKMLQKIQKHSQIRDAEDFHVGLANVNSRLKYIYGNSSGLDIESEPGRYTRVRLTADFGGGPDTNECLDC